jgi:hypothetical protein
MNYRGPQYEELSCPGVSISEPYAFFFHNREEIRKSVHQAEKQTAIHINLLLDFMERKRPATWKKQDKIESGDCRKIFFEDLFLLYPRGKTVFSKDDGRWRAFKVDRVEMGMDPKSDPLRVHAFYLDFDKSGMRLVPQLETLTVCPFSFERSIADLAVIPQGYTQDLDLSCDELIERGKKYWEYNGQPAYREYNGDAWPTTSQEVGCLGRALSLLPLANCSTRVH